MRVLNLSLVCRIPGGAYRVCQASAPSCGLWANCASNYFGIRVTRPNNCLKKLQLSYYIINAVISLESFHLKTHNDRRKGNISSIERACLHREIESDQWRGEQTPTWNKTGPSSKLPLRKVQACRRPAVPPARPHAGEAYSDPPMMLANFPENECICNVDFSMSHNRCYVRSNVWRRVLIPHKCDVARRRVPGCVTKKVLKRWDSRARNRLSRSLWNI